LRHANGCRRKSQTSAVQGFAALPVVTRATRRAHTPLAGTVPALPGMHTLKWRFLMIGWALTFLIIAIVAAIFGFTGIAGAATNIAWILFVVGLALAIILALTGRRPPL